MVDFIADYYAGIDGYPVRSAVSPGFLTRQLPDTAPSRPEPDALAAARAAAIDTDPLYCNFTSGSTGTPKGVLVSHRSVIDFIPVFCSTFGIREDDVIANQAPFDFDVSVKDIYSMLCMRATMQVIPRAYFSQPTLLTDISVTPGAAPVMLPF